MKRFTAIAYFSFASVAFSAYGHAHASTANEVARPYIGTAFGAAFGNREIDSADSSNDEGLGRSAKIYVGYQLTETYGVQIGYVRMRDLNQNTGAGATLVKQTVTGRSAYLAGTARLPFGESFALTGKIGVSFGKVTDTNPSTVATSSLLGSKTSMLVGTGVEYLLNDKLSFSIELESYGKISSQVKGNSFTLGSRFTF
jgi:OOP family OmpA-OmpF porin